MSFAALIFPPQSVRTGCAGALRSRWLRAASSSPTPSLLSHVVKRPACAARAFGTKFEVCEEWSEVFVMESQRKEQSSVVDACVVNEGCGDPS